MVLKLYMMYILYLNHGKELKANAPAIDWCFMYRWSRFMPIVMVLVTHNIFEISCKYAINKIPQLAMHCNVRDGGMISQGIGRGVTQTPESQ